MSKYTAFHMDLTTLRTEYHRARKVYVHDFGGAQSPCWQDDRYYAVADAHDEYRDAHRALLKAITARRAFLRADRLIRNYVRSGMSPVGAVAVAELEGMI